jgi:hypothetical protein
VLFLDILSALFGSLLSKREINFLRIALGIASLAWSGGFQQLLADDPDPARSSSLLAAGSKTVSSIAYIDVVGYKHPIFI